METLQDPIAFILEEHDRQFEICAHLETLVSASESEPSARWAASLLEFLTKDLPVHIEDEERDLFPMLAARQGDNQDLPVILDQLVLEHELDRGLVEPIVDDLRDVAEGRVLADPTRFDMYVRTFTEAMRRHINWENRVVLPLARRLLSEEDRAHLGGRITDRRRNLAAGGG
jgi:hemerythrin-like domain-containing protein